MEIRVEELEKSFDSRQILNKISLAVDHKGLCVSPQDAKRCWHNIMHFRLTFYRLGGCADGEKSA